MIYESTRWHINKTPDDASLTLKVEEEVLSDSGVCGLADNTEVTSHQRGESTAYKTQKTEHTN